MLLYNEGVQNQVLSVSEMGTTDFDRRTDLFGSDSWCDLPNTRSHSVAIFKLQKLAFFTSSNITKLLLQYLYVGWFDLCLVFLFQ